MSSTTPPWPSLYNPGLEITHIEHHSPTQQGGAYLYSANDIFRFTFYWTLAFYTPIFFLCGLYAFFNYAVPPQRSAFYLTPPDSDHSSEQDQDLQHDNLRRRTYTVVSVPLQSLHSPHSPSTPRSIRGFRLQTYKKNEQRSRITFAILILLLFLTLGVAGAVIGSAILGFTVMGLYRSANFTMSTWIPFLLAVIQVLVGLLSLWPSIIEII